MRDSKSECESTRVREVESENGREGERVREKVREKNERA